MEKNGKSCMKSSPLLFVLEKFCSASLPFVALCVVVIIWMCACFQRGHWTYRSADHHGNGHVLDRSKPACVPPDNRAADA